MLFCSTRSPKTEEVLSNKVIGDRLVEKVELLNAVLLHKTLCKYPQQVLPMPVKPEITEIKNPKVPLIIPSYKFGQQPSDAIDKSRSQIKKNTRKPPA